GRGGRAPAGRAAALEVERAGVDAEPVAGRPRAVREDVAEVPTAAGARDLGPHHAVAAVLVQLDGFGVHGGVEAGPARPGVVLRVGAEQLGTAAGAPVDAVIL